MKVSLPVLVTGAVVLAGLAATAPAQMGGHKIVSPQQITWAPAPPSVPAGAQVAVLYGDPGKEGAFAMRLKLPKGYRIPPHTHPKPEIVTVISGTFRLGMGERLDAGTAQALPAGGFFAMPPGMAHYAIADEETVVQLNGEGPWGITYVNPSDDPRKKTN